MAGQFVVNNSGKEYAVQPTQTGFVVVHVGIPGSSGSGGGKGTVTAVNDILPDSDGNVTLTAADVDADPAGAAATVAGNLSTHTGLTTPAHGGIVSSSDSRLTDSRTPTAAGLASVSHAATSKATPVDADELTGTDSANSYSLIRITCANLYTYINGKLANVYAALSHASRHYSAGADALTPANIGAEPAAGNPASDGYIWSSTAAGVRSWIAMAASVTKAAVDAVLHTATAHTYSMYNSIVCNVGGGIDANTTVLLHFNGTNGSTTISDSAFGGGAPHAFTCQSNAQLTTTTPKFGSACLTFDNSSYVLTADHADWDYAENAPWTFEANVWINSDYVYIWGGNPRRSNGVQNPSYYFGVLSTAITFGYHNGSSWVIDNTTNVTVSTGVWHHVACTRNASGIIQFWLDGVQIGSDIAYTGTMTNAASYMCIGGCKNSGYTDFGAGGKIDELRISNICRYTANFTPPTSEFIVTIPGTPTEVSCTSLARSLLAISTTAAGDRIRASGAGTFAAQAALTALGNLTGTAAPVLVSDSTHTATVTGAITSWTLSGLVSGETCAIHLSNSGAYAITTTGLTLWPNTPKALDNIATDGAILIIQCIGSTYYAIC